MTKTQKILFYLGVPVLALLISLPFWPERYGDSYSEQQRKLWNERMALDEKGTDYVDDSSCSNRYHGDHSSIKQQWKNNDRLSERLQETSAPDLNVKIPSSPNLSVLPPEGMTFDELLHHAEHKKDPEAYLLLLSFRSEEYDEPTKTWFQFMKKCVVKAHELKRPGSDFLLHAIDRREETLGNKNETNIIPLLETVNGYEEARKLIESGDFALYRALTSIWPDLLRLRYKRTSMRTGLEAALESKAHQGDATAQRQLGHLGFLCMDTFLFEMERRMDRAKWVLWLSKQAEKWCPNLITIRTTMNSSPARDKLDEYAAWLKKAAETGDLVAMDLWLHYGIKTLNYFSKNDWNNILTYNEILLNAGYETAIPVSSRGISVIRPYHSRSREIIQRYYSPDSFKRTAAEGGETLFTRGSPIMTDMRLGQYQFEKTRESMLDLIERAKRQNPEILSNRRFFLPFINQCTDETIKQRVAGIFREVAREGDPLFMSLLAYMIRNKIISPEFPGEDIQLLEKAFNLRSTYNPFYYYPPFPWPSNHTCEARELVEFVVHNLMVAYLIDNPSPENKRKAFDVMEQYLVYDGGYRRIYDGIVSYNAASRFYASLIHQKGYGTAKDPEKAKLYHDELIKYQSGCDKKEIDPLMELYQYETPE